jgi:linoleate 10R-lipoxygenase
LEWNSDPEIATAAEQLYGDIELLELYVGLQAEEAKPLVAGAGLCPGKAIAFEVGEAHTLLAGYTISRAILSDAIALTRGDRFFTHDFTPHNLTAWGFADCQRDPNAFGFGSTLARLLLRTLPNHFNENSIYTFFPLMTPAAMTTILTQLKVLDQYDLTRPKPKSPVACIEGHSNVTSILNDKGNFTSPYAARAAKIIKGNG